MDQKCETASNHTPSGHSHPRSVSSHKVNPISVARCSAVDYLKQYENFAGPYKEYNPPGNRTPAVGEKIWGDHAHLPSYQDPMYTESVPQKKPDNLHSRGPFYKGVSESHTEYVNRGVLPGRTFHKYVRHYEEPGLKDEISVTQSDFRPPLPMLPRDKAPCLKEDSGKDWYEPKPNEPKNPHAKELEYSMKEPETVYIEEGFKRDFSTEHSDNFVCFHEKKKGSKYKDIAPVKEEIFLKNIRDSHRNCAHPLEETRVCNDSCYVKQQCPGATPQKIDWLLQPMNNTFRNGIMLIPCDCRKLECNQTIRQ